MTIMNPSVKPEVPITGKRESVLPPLKDTPPMPAVEPPKPSTPLTEGPKK